MADVTWWNFYFRLLPSTIRSSQVIKFLSHVLRDIPGKLLIVWDGLADHVSRTVWTSCISDRAGPGWNSCLPMPRS